MEKVDENVPSKWWKICVRDSASATNIYIASARACARVRGLQNIYENIRSTAYAASWRVPSNTWGRSLTKHDARSTLYCFQPQHTDASWPHICKTLFISNVQTCFLIEKLLSEQCYVEVTEKPPAKWMLFANLKNAFAMQQLHQHRPRRQTCAAYFSFKKKILFLGKNVIPLHQVPSVWEVLFSDWGILRIYSQTLFFYCFCEEAIPRSLARVHPYMITNWFQYILELPLHIMSACCKAVGRKQSDSEAH